MEIVWQNLKVSEFYKICRLCLANNNKKLEPVTGEQKNTLIKLTPWIAQLETSIFFPNKICLDCAKQLLQVNEFLNKCNTLANSFHQCIEEYKERVSLDSRLPCLEELLFTTNVNIKQETEQLDDDSEDETTTTMPFTEVFVDEIKKEKEETMEFEDPTQPTTSNSVQLNNQFDDDDESNDSKSDNPECSSESLKESPGDIALSLIPKKSERKYDLQHKLFLDWCDTNNVKKYTENVLLSYLSELSQKYKSSTLWSVYSMLKATLAVKNDLNIGKYYKLTAFLKQQSVGYTAKKSRILTREEINKFILEAPDDFYLMTKVALIIGIAGACRCNELTNITVDNVVDKGDIFIIQIPDSKTNNQRTFTISNSKTSNVIDVISMCRKYFELRPKKLNSRRLFVKYNAGKCAAQNVGKHKIANQPSMIAKFLKLPHPEEYTGHCFRRSSATLIADAGADFLTIKRHMSGNHVL